MKIGFRIVFWVLSSALALMALALFFGGVLPGLLMLSAAIVINPLFLEGIQLKKGLTVLLVIGLFITAFAVLPAVSETEGDEDAAAVNANINSIQSFSVINDEGIEQKETFLKANLVEDSYENEITLGPTITPTNAPTPSPTPSSTPTATPTATPTPKPTATPKPTVLPTPTEAITRSKAIGITILDYSESVGRGERAFIEIQGAPNTDYTCDVEYKSGYSTADGLGTKQSDSEGVVRWSWKVGSRTSLDFTPTIYISGGGDSVSVDFEVTK